MRLTNSFESRNFTPRDELRQAKRLESLHEELDSRDRQGLNPEQVKTLQELQRKTKFGIPSLRILDHLLGVSMFLNKSGEEFGVLQEALENCGNILGKALSLSTELNDLRVTRGVAIRGIDVAHLVCRRGEISTSSSIAMQDFFQRIIDAVDVYENIHKGNVVFYDNYLAITWFSSFPELNKQFKTRGETVIAVKRSNGLWTFDRYSDNVRVPIATLRRAKKVCREWNKQKLFGQVTHVESEKISRFLGFNVAGSKAILKPKSRQGFGLGRRT